MSAHLHFRFGAMGSSKTALVLMMAYNYREKGRKPLLCKPKEDKRTDKIWSRIGLETDCISLEEVCQMPFDVLAQYDCIIVDETQFASKEQIEFLANVVDYLEIPVFCYGLKTNYLGELFTGSKRLLELADEIEEIKTTCWCGDAAKFSARIDVNGNIVKNNENINDSEKKTEYVSLCRKHYSMGKIAP